MPRVLHLRGLSADAQTRRLHQTLTDRLGTEFPADGRTIGHGGDHRHAVAAAVAARRSTADLVVAYGLPALAAAVMAGRGRPVLFVPDCFLGPRSVRAALALVDLGDVHMACPTDAQRRLAVTRGIPADRCHVIRPGADFGRVREAAAGRVAMRRSLGFADDDVVLLAPGESTVAADHDRAVWTCGILHILDPRYKLLIAGRGPRAGNAVRFAAKLKQGHMVVAADATLGRPASPEELLSAADACLVAPAGVVPTLPVVSAMAAGVPCVGVVTYATSELLEDRHTALMVGSAAPKQLGRRVMDLWADPAATAKVVDAARAEAYQLHTQAKMVDRYRRVLRQMGQRRAVDPDAD